jgi:hypothetical protein
MIDILGEVRRIQSMDNNETFDRSTDSLEALSMAISLIISVIGQMSRPEMQYYEGWQDELGIDMTLWALTHPAGAPWGRGAGAGVMADGLTATCTLNANDIARIVTTFRDPIGPNNWGVNSILRLVEFEFEMTVTNLANLDNTQCFFGLTPNQADTRVSNNVIGFALIGAGNALQTVTDLAGVETVNTGFGENLANKNKFHIVIGQTALGVATILFYLNEALIATHITNLPDLPMYKNWYFDTTAGGGMVPQIGINRLWTEDFQRP